MDRISKLKKQLDYLRRLDRGLCVHGATGHRYKCCPLTVDQVNLIEKRAGHPLADDLREWLIRVGFGAGPGYGVFRLGSRKLVENWWTLKRSLGFWTFNPENAPGPGEFPTLAEITKEDAELKIEDVLQVERTENGFPEGGPPKFTTRAYLGGKNILTLSDDGCSFSYVTPLVGPLKGRIFYTTNETIEEIDGVEHDWSGVFWLQGIVRTHSHPWFDNAEARLSTKLEEAFEFLDWMENWLEEETYLVENLDRYHEQVKRHQTAYQIPLAAQS